MTASNSACRCTVLATGTAGKVLSCPACGTVHVALPQLSLRLERGNFRDLVYLLATAQLALEGELESSPRARVGALH
jgi:hypothetical protein